MCALRRAGRTWIGPVSRVVVRVWSSHSSCPGCELASGQERFYQTYDSAEIPDVGHFLHIEAPV
jgi:hypothetical protein